MNLSEWWTNIEAMPLSANMYDVFAKLCNHPEWPLLPVVDAQQRPVGVVREYDLKSYAYGRFGRELIKRHPLSDFLKPILVLSHEIGIKDLLESVAKNPSPDGIVLTSRGQYQAVLLPGALLRLFERQHLESEVRLVQAQKMEAIGTLAGGVAHDLNNILTPILGYTELMSLMQQDGEPIETDMIDQINVSAKRAREVVKQMLAFSRHQKNERCAVRLGEIIKESLRLVRASLPSTIDIEMRLTAEEDTVLANSAELHRVILNLCTNASHAMREHGGQLLISLERHRGHLLGWSLHPEIITGDFLRLSITDTGTGIAPQLLPRIFEPFFTTKKQGEGTGLGLSVVHGIVTRCQGLISVESVVGQGTTFHLYLPCQAQKPAEQHSAPKEASALTDTGSRCTAGRRIHVLLVDDEFAITRMASVLLPKYGITLETENDSVKALNLLHERTADFDLLITDQTMPGITGVDLARLALEIRPELPIILCTGYSEAVSPEQARDVGICEYLLKPTDFRQMAALIQKRVAPIPVTACLQTA